jgi:hypothetical protein
MNLLSVSEIFEMSRGLSHDFNMSSVQYAALERLMQLIENGLHSKYKTYYVYQQQQDFENCFIQLQLKALKVESDDAFHFAIICFIFFQIFNADICRQFMLQSEMFCGYPALWQAFVQAPGRLLSAMKMFYSQQSVEHQLELIEPYSRPEANLILQSVTNAFLAEIYLSFKYAEAKDLSEKLPRLNLHYNISYKDSQQIEPATIYVSFKQHQVYFKMLTWTGRIVNEQNSMIIHNLSDETSKGRGAFETKLLNTLEKLHYIAYLTTHQQTLQLQFEHIKGFLELQKFDVTQDVQNAQPSRVRNNFLMNRVFGKAQANPGKIAQCESRQTDIQSKIMLLTRKSEQFVINMHFFNFMHQLLGELYIELDIFLQGLEKQVIERTDIQFDFKKMNDYFEKIVFLQSRPEFQYSTILDVEFNAEVQAINPTFYRENIFPLIDLEKEIYQQEKEKRDKEFTRLLKRKDDILSNLVKPSFRALELKSVPWFDKFASLVFHTSLFGMAVVALSFSPQILAFLAIQMSLPLLQALMGLVLFYEGYQVFNAIKNCFQTSSIFYSNMLHQAGIAPPTPNNCSALSMTA